MWNTDSVIWALLLAAVPQLAASAAPPSTVGPPAPAVVLPPPAGLGPKLAAAVRKAPGAQQRFFASGLDEAAIRAAGGRVHAVVGPVTSGSAPASAIHGLAALATSIEAPQHLRPLLDVSRVRIGADRTDFGDGFDRRYRGDGVLIAIYDSGVSADHPDFRDDEGRHRFTALWHEDSDTECDVTAALAVCPVDDPIGHGTHVLSIAGGNAPRFRGVAPNAKLVVAGASRFVDLVAALAWFAEVAKREAAPMVVNLSLGGQEGAHDGTSAEARAIDGLGYLVVAAAGNEGNVPIHASTRLTEAPTHAAINLVAAAGRSVAVVDMWGEVDATMVASALVIGDGAVLADTGTIASGQPGRTVRLEVGGLAVATVELDAEAGPNPHNHRPHIRLEIDVPEVAALDGSRLAVRLHGSGEVHLWLDAPPEITALPVFDSTPTLATHDQVLGDSRHSISDPATAASAVAVASFISRQAPPAPGDVPTGDQALSAFSAAGPSLDPAHTRNKPDIAAPGEFVVAAAAADTGAAASTGPLYRPSSGTSVAAPHAAGAAAVLLAARPDADPAAVKRWLIDTAQSDETTADPARWGAGKLDVNAALAAAVGLSDCGCRSAVPARTGGHHWYLLLLSWGFLRARSTRVTSG